MQDVGAVWQGDQYGASFSQPTDSLFDFDERNMMSHSKLNVAIVMTRSIAFIAACVVMLSPANVFAAIITQPTSLSLGDTYRLAFVTSTARDATSTNIADYNTFVTLAANAVPALASLGTTWTAIGSTATVAARDNTDTVPSTVPGGSLGVPIFLLNDTKLVDSNDDLWDGSIDVLLNRTELDTAIVAQVWTGTTSAGLADSADFDQDGDTDGADFLAYQIGFGIVAPNATKADGDADDDLDVDKEDLNIWELQYGSANPPIPLGSTFSMAVVGRTDQTSSGWIHATTATPTTTDRPFYAISGELVKIPEPATATLMLLGLLGLGVRRRS